MTDPYQVLGIHRGASDEEIKKAYRSLSRRYHPDANVNNPNKAQAEERFKQVQQAYDQIMKEKQQGMAGGYSGYAQGERENGRAQQGPFGGFSGTYYYGNNTYRSASQEQSPKMQAALNYMRSQSYAEALHVLNDIPLSERKGRWYYYSAMANQGLGNKATALEHIQMAVALEPSNMEFRQFKQHLEYGGTWYSNMGSAYERPYSSYGNFCVSLLCMQALCTCCCRPF
ncbi:MAG: DnaJ domain-containing protein [Muribaculaceae bacterium]|nr:DnaJ domain-containing protein [Roseburia sp.]MCM1430276.1 DnaJ domain-containing protein [Muribaculaceae bacterium]MCM1492615.1 DnaJ domain-containing protein [Muribaculaceae bacterium]